MAHMITRDELISLMMYDPATGEFRWRTSGKGRPWHGLAGTKNQHGQIIITVGYRRYLASRLAWLYMFGEPIPDEIDHANGNCSDNRIDNLRSVTHSQNLANSKTRLDNTSGERGVCWDKQKGKWKVQVGPAGNRVQKHLVDYDEAVSFARKARFQIFGEYLPEFRVN